MELVIIATTGVFLGAFFRVAVLLPATGFASLLIASLEAMRVDVGWDIVVVTFTALSVLQIGYLVGAAARLGLGLVKPRHLLK